MSSRLLILEDDDNIRAALALTLSDEGYDVVDAHSAESALEILKAAPVDLMLVDLNLGGMDGFEFIRTVRPHHDAPVIVLSARDDTHDIVAALESGADDYVTKPYQLKEVTARLRALRRRGGAGKPGSAEAEAAPTTTPAASESIVLDSTNGPLMLAPEAGRLSRGGVDVHLTVTEFRLLCELADPPGRVLSRQQLLEKVWDRGFFGDERIVDVHIRRLRTKIEADPARPQLVVTVRGLGYRLDQQ